MMVDRTEIAAGQASIFMFAQPLSFSVLFIIHPVKMVKGDQFRCGGISIFSFSKKNIIYFVPPKKKKVVQNKDCID